MKSVEEARNNLWAYVKRYAADCWSVDTRAEATADVESAIDSLVSAARDEART